ncbi:MAG: FtsX-like permease family protein [Burkholderiales bacterium]|nr:FtsX-like permease family protein [Burkholderiales bacterium]
MLRLVYRQLRLDPLRTVLTATALAAVVAVILVLEGFYGGLLVQLRNTVLDRNADLIVTQAGVANMTATRSILPQFTRRDVEAVDGVAVAHPLTGISVIYEQDNKRTALFLLVYDSGGGPNRLVEGSKKFGSRDIVVDRSLAGKYDLRVGDPFIISDFEFRIAGFSLGSAAFFTPFGFASYDDLIDFYFESDIAADISTFPLLSFLLVELSPGANRDAVRAAIEASVPDGDVFTPEQLAAEDESLGRVLFGPIMRLLVGVGYIIGAIVTGIIMFAAVNARRHDFGVLKALGFSEVFLSLSVVVEALALAVFAIPLGVVLAGLIGNLVEITAPLYLVLATEPLPILRTAAACLLFAAMGALLPIRLIRGVDPSLAFRS